MKEKQRQESLIMDTPPEKMFYKIREVAKIAEVKPHVLRYWESEFANLKPQKNKNGQRTYTKKEIDLILEIKRLLHGEKYSIAGAKQHFRKKRSSANGTAKGAKKGSPLIAELTELRDDLGALREELAKQP